MPDDQNIKIHIGVLGNSATDGGEWLTARSDPFNPKGSMPVIHWMRDWANPRFGVEVHTKKLMLLEERNPDYPVLFSDWAIFRLVFLLRSYTKKIFIIRSYKIAVQNYDVNAFFQREFIRTLSWRKFLPLSFVATGFTAMVDTILSDAVTLGRQETSRSTLILKVRQSVSIPRVTMKSLSRLT